MIKRLILATTLSFVILVPQASAQSPAATAPASTPAATSAATTAPTATSAPVEEAAAPEDGESAPWIRLVWLVPLAVVFGVGSVIGRRLLIERGWLDAA